MIEQTPEVPEKQTEPETVPVCNKPCCQYITILLVVIGLLFVVGAVYTGMQISKKRTPVVLPTAPPPEVRPIEASPTSIPDETANWKTYSNQKYGFEFKYPQNFQITAEGLGQYFLNQKPAIVLESDNFIYLHNQINAILTVSVKSNAKSECDYVPRGVTDTLRNQVINGIDFTVFSESGAATGNFYSNTIFHYLKDTTCYEMVTTIHESSDGNTPEALPKINEQKAIFNKQFDQILSTFKFLD